MSIFVSSYLELSHAWIVYINGRVPRIHEAGASAATWVFLALDRSICSS